MYSGSKSQNLINREQNQMKIDELPVYEFAKLEAATNNFHFGNILGKGGFGPVYKVILSKIFLFLCYLLNNIYYKSNFFF